MNREKRTNEWLLNKAETEGKLLESIRKRRLTYFGHSKARKKEETWIKKLYRGTCRVLEQIMNFL